MDKSRCGYRWRNNRNTKNELNQIIEIIIVMIKIVINGKTNTKYSNR